MHSRLQYLDTEACRWKSRVHPKVPAPMEAGTQLYVTAGSNSRKQRAKELLCLVSQHKRLYGLLTTILLIAAVGAVIISITSPHDRDARSALALKLPGLTLWLRVSSCVLREIFFKKRKKERQTVCHFHFSFRDHIMNFTGVNQRNKNATNYKQVWEVNWQTFICD